MDLPSREAITFLSFSASASIPTDERIFSMSFCVGEALPPITANNFREQRVLDQHSLKAQR
ncbi:GSCOCG00003582001-RA-CDS [Cotesia congregata]|nr:GSCOCG00003582001-RA-CDS [Cotesia congregata]